MLSKKQIAILKQLVEKPRDVNPFSAADIEELEVQGLIEQFYFRDEYVPYEGMGIRITSKGLEILNP